jgi:pyruvate/2-oxoglutarate dehydrogenase complex dihydrolipoamide acyltransferase (E2) component
MHKLLPFLLPKRTECEVFLRESIDVTEALKYLERRKEIDGNNVTLFSLLMATLVRTIAMRPALNNFVCGHRLYRRKGIDIGFVVKKEFNDTGAETVVRIVLHPSSTVTEVSDRLYAHVNDFRSSGSSGTDKTIEMFTKVPRFMTKFAIALLRFLNYYGKVPKGLTELDPNFTSAFIANMGSLKANAPFHHLNNWGTNSLFITIGAIEDRVCVVDNEITVRKFIDLAFTVDERIADGYYFAKSIKVMRDILSDPSSLESPLVPEEFA